MRGAFQQAVVVHHYGGVGIIAQVLQPLLGDADSLPLQVKWSGDHGHHQCTHLPGNPCHHRCRAGACATAHAREDEHQIYAPQQVLQVHPGALCRFSSHHRVSSCPHSPGELSTDQQLLIRHDGLQMLAVGVYGHCLRALDAHSHKPSHSVSASAAAACDQYPGGAEVIT